MLLSATLLRRGSWAVIQARDGVAFPDTCVGTDSHTPHVDALGVIAIGVGGLEAETVMLGHPSMMRLPDIVGVKLTGQRKPGITATDIVLALTEFLRKERVVGAYVEFFGEGADSLSIGDRATISNMCPEYGATAAMFYIGILGVLVISGVCETSRTLNTLMPKISRVPSVNSRISILLEPASLVRASMLASSEASEAVIF